MSTQALSGPISSLSLLLVQTQVARWKAAGPEQLTSAHLYIDIAKVRLHLSWVFLWYEHAWCQGHVNMVCNPWLETWDVAIIYTGDTRICVTVQWTTVYDMTLSPAKLNPIRTTVVYSRVMTGNPKHKAWVLPVYIRCTTLQLTVRVFDNKNFSKWDLMFGF